MEAVGAIGKPRREIFIPVPPIAVPAPEPVPDAVPDPVRAPDAEPLPPLDPGPRRPEPVPA
jgi:hypothetical protein